jgi:acetoin utilization protein AcuB
MLVKDRMTPNPITLTPDTSFPEAFHIMREKRIRHLPVVDEKQKLIGIVTQTDLLHASPSVTPLSIFEVNYLLANLHIREVMSSPAVTVPEDAPLEEAAQLMVQKKIGSLPVVRDDVLVGMITETDIFRAFVEVLASARCARRTGSTGWGDRSVGRKHLLCGPLPRRRRETCLYHFPLGGCGRECPYPSAEGCRRGSGPRVLRCLIPNKTVDE